MAKQRGEVYTSKRLSSHDRNGLVPGDTVYIRFWAYYANEGAFLICASPNISTLPVELLSFTATAESDGILLNWTTASERNSDHFTVEHSTDNRIFTAIGELPAAGSSSSQLHYALLHRTPSTGINYYRLVQVDKDGSTERSWTEACRADRGTSALLYPNPVQDLLSVQLATDLPKGATIWVNGAMDRSMAQVPVKALQDGRSFTVDTQRLPPGTYFLRMVAANGEVSMIGAFLKL